MPEELTVRRGSVGLGRSKSVRCSRVKFGLVSLDDDEGDCVGGDDDEGDQGSAKGKTKREAAKRRRKLRTRIGTALSEGDYMGL